MGSHRLILILAAVTGCGSARASKSAPARPTMAVADAQPRQAEAIVAASYAEDDGRAEIASESTSDSDSTPAPAATPSASQGTPTMAQSSVAQRKEALVIEGWMSIEVEDAAATAQALRAEVEKLGGRVVSERLDGAATSWTASIKIRIPPAGVDAAVGWLESQGEVTGKRIEASDVSKTLFDQEIALGNLRLTLDRLRKLLEAGALKMEDILAIEREMTRLRGEIERIEGEKRWLEDRVAYATIDIELTRREGVLMSPKTKVYPGPRLVVLTLFGADGRKQHRLGGGVAMHIGIPRVSLELDIFNDIEAEDGHPREDYAFIATFGGAFYSDFLGRGQREFLNPYIGMRAGYAYLDYNALALQAEIGVELYKQKYVMVDANVRATGLLNRDQADAALVSGLSVVFAF